MKTINISEVISQAWELTKKNWLFTLVIIIGISIVTNVISSIMGTANTAQIISLLQQPNPDPVAILGIYTSMIPTAAVSNFLQMILLVGLYQYLLNASRGNNELSLDNWKQPIMVYVNIIITGIVVGLITLIGVAFCIVPGLYLYARLQFAPYYLLDHKEANIGDAISASWNMTSSSAFSLIGLMLLFVLIALVGLLCCCIGILVAEIIIYFAVVVCYLTLHSENPTQIEN